MNRRKQRLLNIVYILVVGFSIAMLSCSGGGGDEPPVTETYTEISRSNTYSGPGIQVFHVATTGNVNLTHSLDLGSNVRDVYYVFTNVTQTSTAVVPTVSLDAADIVNGSLYSWSPVPREIYPETITIIRGSEEIDAFARDPFLFIDRADPMDALKNALDVPAPLMDAVLDKVTFYGIEDTKVDATCRKVVPKDAGNGIPVTLNIYVADDCWHEGGTKAKVITQTMVDVLANKFIATGDDNDIYEWLTTIFGIEWGPHLYDEYIGDNDEITILLYDIASDNSTTGGYLGAFHPRDNVKIDYYLTSNQRIMFYIDAVLYATEEGAVWAVDDFWPEYIISTLAHEFQHMIHFYQKNVLRVPGASGSETWLTEMCSVVAEDLVARLMQVDGPRGVYYNDGTAGSPNNTVGLLPLYNYWNDLSVFNWNTTTSYSIVYSFGAFLARNYGGVTFFRNLVQNNKTDYTAVTGALAAGGYTDDFALAMRKWGSAVILSNSTSAPAGYRYNTGTWITSSLGGINYNLGSINLYNYAYSSLLGPYIYETSPVGFTTYQQSASNAFYLVGKDLSKTVKRTVKFEDNIQLTVVVVP